MVDAIQGIPMNLSSGSINEMNASESVQQEPLRSNRLLLNIVSFLPDPTMAIDLNGKVIAWNRAMESITGVSAEDILGKGNYEYSLPFYNERRPILIDLVLNPIEGIDKKYPFIQRDDDGKLTADVFLPNFKDGTHFFMAASVLRDSEGNPIGAIESLRDISEMKRVEKALRESESTYRTIFENTGTATIIIEEDTTISLINGEMERLSGYGREEVEGKMSWTKLVTKDDLEKMIAQHHLRRSDPSSALKNYEFRLVDKNGCIKDLLLSIAMIPGSKRSVASFLDITERKRVEEELRNSEGKYRTMFDNTGTAMMIIEPDTIVYLVNKEFEKLTGYNKEEIEGKMSWTKFVVKEDLERMMEYHRQRRLTGSPPPREYEYRLIDKSGNIKDMFLTISMIPGTKKSVASLMDITEHKKIVRNIKESERRMADIIQFLPDATFVVDNEGKIIAWNKAIMKLTGVKAEEMMGKIDHEYSLPFYSMRRSMLIDLVLHPDEDLEEEYQDLLRDSDSYIAEIFLPDFKPGGAYLWTKASPLYDFQGTIAGAIETMRDVTEMKRTQQSLERSRAELHIAAEIQKSFIPKRIPAVSDFNSAAVTLPALEVGGDFYDFISLPEDRQGMVIADVAGKGVPAALFMALSRTIVRANAAHKSLIRDVLKETNNMIAADTTAGMFVTLIYGILDGANHTLSYSNAGHPAPLIFKSDDGKCIELKSTGVALGIVEGLEYEEHLIQFSPGDIAVFYTDGVTEAVNSKNAMYGINRLSNVVASSYRLTAEEIIDTILRDISDFSGSKEQFDDITLIVIKSDSTKK
jgi:PAS domain S-box-containing protein